MTNFPQLGTPDDVLDYMGHTFVETRRASVSNAWRFYLECLLYYQKVLRPVIGIEAIIERTLKIEDFLKDSRTNNARAAIGAEEMLDACATLLTGDGGIFSKLDADGDRNAE